ncbi:MAG TPA: hypothetical protein VFJ57_12530 [Solirubrobacterales bacterium]|jgi:hypothetical protein|nr:hypothetical protein [Solirubrobacterales bacterium]
MPTYIRFGDDHSIAVQETLEEIRQRIDAAEAAKVPIFEATRIDGAKLLINPSELWTVTEGRKKEPKGKQ